MFSPPHSRERKLDPMPVTVRRFRADEWRAYRALRLRALADSPDAFGSTLEREAAFPDGDWRTRLADGASAPDALPLVALVDESPAGLAWARESGLRALLLDVTAGNSAAVQLYRRLGFVDAGETQPMREGSALRSQPMQLALDSSEGGTTTR